MMTSLFIQGANRPAAVASANKRIFPTAASLAEGKSRISRFFGTGDKEGRRSAARGPCFEDGSAGHWGCPRMAEIAAA
jgi:hypothetical protein